MATVEIGGQTIEVGDNYNDLSEAQQKKFRRRLARRMGIDTSADKKPKETTGIDDVLRFGLGQGLALGFGDEIEAGARSLFSDRSYSEIRDDIRKQLDDYREDNPGKALAMELGGGLLTGGAGLARAGVGAGVRGAIKQAAKVGAGTGAVGGLGTGRGSLEDQLTSTAIGAGLGGTLGAALPAAGTAIKKGIVDPLRKSTGLMSTKATDKAADLKMLQAMEEEGLTPQQVQQRLDQGVDNTMIADVTGEAGRGVARGATVASGKARTIAEDALDARQAESGFAMADDLADSVGANKSAADALDEIVTRQKTAAADDYDKAFNRIEEFEMSNGTISRTKKPIQVNPKNIAEFAGSDGFRQAYNKAQKLASYDGVKLPPMDKMFDQSKRLKYVDAVDGKLEFENSSGQTFTASNAQEAAELLRKFGERSAIAGGDVPAVSYRGGMNYAAEHGFKTNEAAENILREARELVGDDRLPMNFTMQQLHYMKMGMDAAIDSGKRSGSLSGVEQGKLKSMRTAFKNRLNQNENYRLANEKFAGDAALQEAIEEGSKIFKGRPENIKAALKGMSQSEKEAFRIGVAQAVRDRVSDQRTLANSAQDLFKNQTYKDLIRESFPDQKTFDAFSDRMEQRINQEMTRSRLKPSSGSKTAFAEADAGEFRENADILANLLSGRFLSAGGQALGRVTQQQSGGMGQRVARDMFSTDRGAQRAVLDRLAQLSQAEQERLARSGLLGTRVGGSVGATTGLLSGDR